MFAIGNIWKVSFMSYFYLVKHNTVLFTDFPSHNFGNDFLLNYKNKHINHCNCYWVLAKLWENCITNIIIITNVYSFFGSTYMKTFIFWQNNKHQNYFNNNFEWKFLHNYDYKKDFQLLSFFFILNWVKYFTIHYSLFFILL